MSGGSGGSSWGSLFGGGSSPPSSGSLFGPGSQFPQIPQFLPSGGVMNAGNQMNAPGFSGMNSSFGPFSGPGGAGQGMQDPMQMQQRLTSGIGASGQGYRGGGQAGFRPPGTWGP